MGEKSCDFFYYICMIQVFVLGCFWFLRIDKWKVFICITLKVKTLVHAVNFFWRCPLLKSNSFLYENANFQSRDTTALYIGVMQAPITIEQQKPNSAIRFFFFCFDNENKVSHNHATHTHTRQFQKLKPKHSNNNNNYFFVVVSLTIPFHWKSNGFIFRFLCVATSISRFYTKLHIFSFHFTCFTRLSWFWSQFFPLRNERNKKRTKINKKIKLKFHSVSVLYYYCSCYENLCVYAFVCPLHNSFYLFATSKATITRFSVLFSTNYYIFSPFTHRFTARSLFCLLVFAQSFYFNGSIF